MAITNKEEGVWILPQVYNKINEGDIWDYDGITTMYNWGYSNHGQLGRGNKVSLSSPTLLPGTGWMRSYGTTPSTNKITGDSAQFAIKSDGTLWSWGWGEYGSLGLNGNTYYSSPVQVGANTNWKGIPLSVCNNITQSAWTTDGALFVWGSNAYGQLGLNESTGWPSYKASPTQLPGSWKVAINAELSMHAIKNDGTYWSWGENDYGQLGHNNKTDYSSPRQVGTDTTWDKIHGAHSDEVFVTKTDGSLWAWGRNNQGQLGQNNNTEYSSPKQIPGDYSGAGFSVAYHTAIVTKSDGTLWSWGYNGNGILGQNNPQNSARSSPVQIGSGTDWDPDGMSGGGFQAAAAIKTDGSLFMWGRNLGGVLGQNQTAPSNNNHYSSPVQVPGTWSSIRIAGRTSYGTQSL